MQRLSDHQELSTPIPSPEAVPSWITGRLAAALVGAWLLGLAWVFAVTPEADPAEPLSLLDNVMATAHLASWVAVFTGLGMRRRWGLTASVIGGGLIAAGGLLCVATGHTGVWVPIQIGVGVGLAALGSLGRRLS